MVIFEYFLVGAFAAIGALLLEIIIDSLGYQLGILDWELTLIVIFVLVEELAKFIVIRRKIDFQNTLNAILNNCFWIGMGFGLSEPLILLLNKKDVFTGNYPAIIAVVLVHIITALLTGLMLAKFKFNGYRAVLALIPALILHLAFNYWIFTH